MNISDMTEKEKEKKLKEVKKKINTGKFTLDDLLDKIQLQRNFTRQEATKHLEEVTTTPLPIM